MGVLFLLVLVVGCGGKSEQQADSEAINPQHLALFQPLPEVMASKNNPITKEKVRLGRMLYYEERLSKNHDISCNSCHLLDEFGVDGMATSPGHRGEFGVRNSPTVYNAALHIAQFWDGREPDVEAQAKGPVLNPVEMAMPDEDHVLKVLKSIPGYQAPFVAAFPGEADPITYDNMAKAIGAFERQLVTPDRFDKYLKGDADALTMHEKVGLDTFIEIGCITCHMGAGVGGNLFQKMGLIEAYEMEDTGRFEVTGNETEKYFFKVPSLRNVAETGPYMHDGSLEELAEIVPIMARYQLGKTATENQVADMVAFMEAMTGEIPVDYIQVPELPESGPDTPAPDPS